MTEKPRPKVGLGVYILNPQNQLLLLYENRGDRGYSWAPPGGHLEFGEEFMDCVKREAKEEVDLYISEAELWQINNSMNVPKWHYVNLDFLVNKYTGTPKIMEPQKCEKMEWFNLNSLPAPLLESVANFFKHNPPCLCKSGKKFLDCHGK